MHMKRLVLSIFQVCLLLHSVTAQSAVPDEFDVSVHGQDLSIYRFPAKGEHLLIWIAPGYGTHERAKEMSQRLARRGVEIWHVDLSDSLFLPKNTSTMRSFDGRYVAGLIEKVYQKTGKHISLMTRSYGALPLLKGVRLWQIKHAKDNADYLAGAMLFSPEMYRTVPALGLDPVYSPITYATSIPIMLYQAGKRGNRWHLDTLVEHLQSGGAQVFVRIKPGVTGMFYKDDKSAATLKMLKTLPDEIVTDLNFLKRLPVTKTARPMFEEELVSSHGLDSALKVFRGNPQPLPLNLVTATGQRIIRDNYKGKVTVVNFWASWCPPCIEEIPSLNNLRKAMQGKPFELISVNYAESRQVVSNFLKRVNVDFPVLLDEDGRVSASWKVIVYPSTFVIGPKGKIVYGVNGAIHWDSPGVIQQLQGLMQQ